MADPIDYAPPDTPPPRRFRKRYLAAALGLLLVLLVAYRWRDVGRYYALTQVWVWQRKCLSHTRPADAVVYAEDEAAIKRLARQPAYQRFTAAGPVLYSANELRQLAEWRSRAGHLSAGPERGATVFLHERRARGSRSLCVVSVIPFVPGGIDQQRHVSFSAESMPVRGLGAGVAPSRMSRPSFILTLEPADRFSLLAGQPDSADGSKFSVPYVLNDVPGTIDGQFRADGSIQLLPRERRPGFHIFSDLGMPRPSTRR